MSIYHKQIIIDTVSGRPSYHNITEELRGIVKESNIKNGMCVVSIPHTTCSVYFDENMHDLNYFGDEYLQVDINNTMDKIAPRCKTENQYNSPGPEHIKFGMSLSDSDYPAEKWTMLNTDAHIRASIFGGASETVIIKDRELLLGSLGRLYFVDWDQNRERKRKCNIMIIGE
jgi:thiamine phosphate synthase YjbQ (UPF0047 family)